MSRTLVDKLIGEMYDAVYNDVPMDHRRWKRLMRLDGDCAETLNKGFAAWDISRAIRRDRRRMR